MEVMAGYKQTDVGVIPDDWEVILLEDLASKIGSGITPTGGETVYKTSGRPFVRSQNIGWGRLLLDDIAYIDDEIHQTFPNTEIRLNDVFLNISGASIGRSSYADQRLVGGNVNQHVCIIRTINERLNPVYLNLFLLSKNGQKQIDSFQSGGNRQGLNIGQIKNFQIPIPNRIEQTAITTTLSDTDNYITSLEKLIAKKRFIKQGAMQKLLQPQDGWVVKIFGAIFDISGGFSASRDQLSDDGFCYLHYGDIHGSKKTYVDCKTEFSNIPKFKIELRKINRKFLLQDGDVVFVDASEDDEGVSRHIVIRNEDDIPFISGLHTIVAKSKDSSMANEFKEYCFQSKYVKDQFKYYAVGTKVSGVSKSSIKNINIYLPPLKTQTHIANILSDMTKEIETLEEKLSKARQLKQGMMQQLLTGKIRLV